MCIRVYFGPRAGLDPWDAEQLIITIPNTLLLPEYVQLAVRAALTELGIEQPESGAVCCCGEQIRLPVVSQQRGANTHV